MTFFLFIRIYLHVFSFSWKLTGSQCAEIQLFSQPKDIIFHASHFFFPNTHELFARSPTTLSPFPTWLLLLSFLYFKVFLAIDLVIHWLNSFIYYLLICFCLRIMIWISRKSFFFFWCCAWLFLSVHDQFVFRRSSVSCSNSISPCVSTLLVWSISFRLWGLRGWEVNSPASTLELRPVVEILVRLVGILLWWSDP